MSAATIPNGPVTCDGAHVDVSLRSRMPEELVVTLPTPQLAKTRTLGGT
jgi:hypothetical protein